MTTLQGFARVGARAGQRILIHAGSGGVGSFAVQYARHLGLEVTATTSSKNADFVTSLGADKVIAYDRENYLDQGGGYDIVYDTLGGAFTADAFKVVKRGGTVISLSGPPDRDFAKDKGVVIRIAVWLMGRRVYAAAEQAGAAYVWFLPNPAAISCARSLHWSSAAWSSRSSTANSPSNNCRRRWTYLEAGRARGKVVLKVR